MTDIATIISDLKYGRSLLLKSIENLSPRELTQIQIYDGWSIKDILAHLIAWDQKTVEILPMIVQDRASEIGSVDPAAFNQQAKILWQDRPFNEVLVQIQAAHQKTLDLIASLDHIEIDKRHNRNDRIVTIRSYVFDTMREHERLHAFEIEQWRAQLDQSIDPNAVRLTVLQARSDLMTLLDRFNEADVLDNRAVGVWSVNDVAGHLADWEQLALQAATHICDPSRPAVSQPYDNVEAWNMVLAEERRDKSWAETYHYLRQTHMATDNFMAGLQPHEWRLRGPYPWFEAGTVAELLSQTAGHYIDHLPDLERWYKTMRSIDS